MYQEPVRQITAAPSAPQAALGPPETSGKAVASLILGLLSFFFVFAILAIVFGHIALSEIKKNAGRLQGRGMAIAGLVLGYLGIAVIPIILIIAAIAIPNLLRARIAANEASAINGVQILNTAERSYQASHEDTGFTCSLSDLRDTGLLSDFRLTDGHRHGYFFVLRGCALGYSGPNRKYQIVAYPVNQNMSGVRAFCSDESAQIKSDANGSTSNCLETGEPLQ